MNTTLLFVEVSIAGLQGLVWLGLLAMLFFGVPSFQNNAMQNLSDWAFLITTLILSFSYSLGIVIDRAANVLYSFWDEKIQRQYKASTNSLSVARFRLENESLNKQLDYVRSRMRIARSSSLNFFLITVFLVIFIHQTDLIAAAAKMKFSLFAGILGAVLTSLFTSSWYSLANTNYNLVAKLDLANRKRKPKKNA